MPQIIYSTMYKLIFDISVYKIQTFFNSLDIVIITTLKMLNVFCEFYIMTNVNSSITILKCNYH